MLLGIGLVHSYLIWMGDILVLYAECGLLLYFFRNLKPRTLITLGILALLVTVPITLGWGAMADYLKAAAARVDAQTKAGKTPSEEDKQLHDAWTHGMQKFVAPSAEIEGRRSGTKKWPSIVAAIEGS